MQILATILVVYTAVMLGVHVTSWRLVGRWYGGAESWAKRWLPPMAVLRGEALYWGLVLAAWPWWRTVPAKVVLAVFAALHIGGWLAAEFSRSRISKGPASARARRTLALAVTAFDLLETLPLLAVGFYCLHLI